MANDVADRMFDAAEDEYFRHSVLGDCREDCHFCYLESVANTPPKEELRRKPRKVYKPKKKGEKRC